MTRRNKKLAEKFGMVEELDEAHEELAATLSEDINGPVDDFLADGDDEEVEVDEVDVEDPSFGKELIEKPELGVDTTYEDQRIREAEAAIDEIIDEGKKAVKEAFSELGMLEPSKRHLANEAAASVMKATIDALKVKLDTSQKSKEYKFDVAKTNMPEGQIRSNVTNIYTDRETLMGMIEREEKEAAEDEGSTDTPSE